MRKGKNGGQWEARWQTDDIGWEKGEPAPPLVDFLHQQQMLGRVLVPGCGSGNDVRAIAAQNPDQVVGLDIAPTALKMAWSRSIGLKNVDFIAADLFAPPHSLCGTFDWVFEHTCFCAINPEMRPDYFESIGLLLKPKGYFLGIFYLNPEKESGPPFGVQPAAIDHYVDESFELIKKWVPEVGFPGRLGREEMRWYQRK